MIETYQVFLLIALYFLIGAVNGIYMRAHYEKRLHQSLYPIACNISSKINFIIFGFFLAMAPFVSLVIVFFAIPLVLLPDSSYLESLILTLLLVIAINFIVHGLSSRFSLGGRLSIQKIGLNGSMVRVGLGLYILLTCSEVHDLRNSTEIKRVNSQTINVDLSKIPS